MGGLAMWMRSSVFLSPIREVLALFGSIWPISTKKKSKIITQKVLFKCQFVE